MDIMRNLEHNDLNYCLTFRDSCGVQIFNGDCEELTIIVDVDCDCAEIVFPLPSPRFFDMFVPILQSLSDYGIDFEFMNKTCYSILTFTI